MKQEDKVLKARERMYHLAIGDTITTFDTEKDSIPISINVGIKITDELKKVINYILETNIIVGNTLTGYTKEDIDNLSEFEREPYRLYLREYKFGGAYIDVVKMSDFWLQPSGLSKEPDRTYNTVEWFKIDEARCKEEELTEEQIAHSKELDKQVENFDF